MANYSACCRTNYFKVTDEKRYDELFSKLVCGDDEVRDFTEESDSGKVHGFGGYGSVDFKVDEDDYNFDLFLSELQKILPEDEAFIYMENGYEKLRYLTGFCIVATRDKIETVDIRSSALKLAQEMLNNPEFKTQIEY